MKTKTFIGWTYETWGFMWDRLDNLFMPIVWKTKKECKKKITCKPVKIRIMIKEE